MAGQKSLMPINFKLITDLIMSAQEPFKILSNIFHYILISPIDLKPYIF